MKYVGFTILFIMLTMLLLIIFGIIKNDGEALIFVLIAPIITFLITIIKDMIGLKRLIK